MSADNPTWEYMNREVQMRLGWSIIMIDGLVGAVDHQLAWEEEYLHRVWDAIQKVHGSIKKDPMTRRVGNEGLHLKDQDLLGSAFFNSRDTSELVISLEDRNGSMVVILSNPDDLLSGKSIDEVRERFSCRFTVTTADRPRGFVVQRGGLSQVFPATPADTPQA